MAVNTAEFELSGIQVLPSVLDGEQVERARGLIDPLLERGDRKAPGIRRVFEREPRLVDLLNSTKVPDILRGMLGPGAAVIRAIVFDKTAETNWMVPWHQDATIAVCERRDVPGFGPWAVKSGEHHCQPPRSIMDRIRTIRIHLDDCPFAAGPLRVLRASHLHGLLTDAEVQQFVSTSDVIEAEVHAGDAVLTCPLAIHSSRRSTLVNARRRVLHLDCTAAELPAGLQWAEQVPLSAHP